MPGSARSVGQPEPAGPGGNSTQILSQHQVNILLFSPLLHSSVLLAATSLFKVIAVGLCFISFPDAQKTNTHMRPENS